MLHTWSEAQSLRRERSLLHRADQALRLFAEPHLRACAEPLHAWRTDAIDTAAARLHHGDAWCGTAAPHLVHSDVGRRALGRQQAPAASWPSCMVVHSYRAHGLHGRQPRGASGAYRLGDVRHGCEQQQRPESQTACARAPAKEMVGSAGMERQVPGDGFRSSVPR